MFVKRLGVYIAAVILAVALFAPQVAQGSNAVPVNLSGPVSTQKATFTPNVVIGPWPGDKTTQVWGYVPLHGVMYACGAFAQVKSADGKHTYARHNLFAFNPNSGTVSSFAPNVNGPIYSCTASHDGKSLFIGGAFSTVNGRAAHNVAKINVATGQLVAGFHASTNMKVTQVQVVGGRLIMSGSFALVNGHKHAALASVSPTTGNLLPYLNLVVAGRVSDKSGVTRVDRFAVSPDQKSVVAIGNFKTVNGVSHSGAFRFEFGATRPQLVNWDNPHFHELCGLTDNMPVWSEDVQFSPNGKFFVIDGTGGRGPAFCDTATRWETSGRGTNVQPTWLNHTCVDTLHSVAVTNTVVYVQGHQKCVMGKGGQQVPRFGMAALNATTGYALAWRSDQTRRVGGKFLMVTSPATNPGFPPGLWAGCDCGPEGGIIFRPFK